jgi:hypothetical protein
MKKSVLITLLFASGLISANAQLTRSELKDPVHSKEIYPSHSGRITLSSENSYLAKRITPSLSLSTETASLARPIPVSELNVTQDYSIGISKHAYGYRNGRLLLRTSGATSSGTITGSGAVGTGSSLGNIGSTGAGIGLNGKTPDAGSGMWGNSRNLLPVQQEKAKIIQQ